MNPSDGVASRVRVLFISTWNEVCGVATYSANLVGELRRAGNDVDVYPLDRAGQVYMTRRERRLHISRCVEAARDADVVHVQHEFGLFGLSPVESLRLTSLMLSRLRSLGKPVIVTFHSLPPVPQLTSAPGRRRTWRERLRMRLARAGWRCFVARHFLLPGKLRAVVHSALARRLLRESGVPMARIDVIAHGVAMRGHDVGRTQARRALGYDDDTILLSLFGFVSAYKGVDTAIEALARLPQNYRMAVIGGRHPASKDDRSFDEALGALRFAQRLRVTGWVDLPTLERYHAATDICIAPYRETGLLSSGAITWALGSGKPTIATRIAAFTELSHVAHCVHLIAEDSPDELAFAAQMIVAQPSLGSALTRAAADYCDANSWERVGARHIDLYRRQLPRMRTQAADVQHGSAPS